MSALSLSGVRTGYGRVTALRDVALAVPEGRRVALVGSNGAGKSTLVKAINGLLPLWAGTLTWDGAPIGTLRPSARTRVGIATVPEGRLLFPDCSVTENLEAASTWGEPKARRQEGIETVCGLFPRACANGRPSASAPCRAASSRWSRSAAP